MTKQSCTQREMEDRARLEFARRRQRPDINRMMATDLVECSIQEQSLTLCHTMTEWEINPQGTMHGGLITYLLDAAMAITHRCCTGDRTTPTMNINVNFIRAVQQGTTVYAKATVLHIGRVYVTMKAQLWAEDEAHLCAAATAMYYRIKAPTATE